MTSKNVRNFLTENNIRLPTIIHTKKKFWNNNKLWNNIIKLEDKIKIMIGLVKMKMMCKITNLKISGLDDVIDVKVFSFLIDMSIRISEDLIQLDFSNNYNIDIYSGDEILHLLKLLRNCPKLESLNLSGNSLTTNKVNKLGKVIPMLTNLTHLDLSHNDILPPQSDVQNGLIYKRNYLKFREFILPKMLSQCLALKHLDLGNNSLGDDGAEALAEALPQCNLVHLNLSQCMIGESGAEALVKMRKQCSTLMYLGLKFNYFVDYKKLSD
jgi:Ran GTPase-activating protein (RanGAP) involved in mRNA processing and transport